MGTHRARGLEGNLIVNVIAPPPLDVSNQVKGLDEQVKSLGSLPNQVKTADDQLRSVSSSISDLTSKQSELKTSLDSITNQSVVLMALAGIATLVSVIALGVSINAVRRKPA